MGFDFGTDKAPYRAISARLFVTQSDANCTSQIWLRFVNFLHHPASDLCSPERLKALDQLIT
jgi:hypothetical protein